MHASILDSTLYKVVHVIYLESRTARMLAKQIWSAATAGFREIPWRTNRHHGLSVLHMTRHLGASITNSCKSASHLLTGHFLNITTGLFLSSENLENTSPGKKNIDTCGAVHKTPSRKHAPVSHTSPQLPESSELLNMSQWLSITRYLEGRVHSLEEGGLQGQKQRSL